MPAPSQVSASNVNTELGVGSSTQLSWGNNWVRNVTTQYTGTNSTVNGSKMRWGINFPGGVMGLGGYNASGTSYDENSTLLIFSSDLISFDGSSVAFCLSEINFFANGVLRLFSVNGVNTYAYHRTWLTSGSAGDYTVQFQHTGGDTPTGGTTNTDLAMSTTRTFVLQATVGPGVGTDYKNTFGNVIVKDGGGTLITRPIELSASAEVI